MVGGETAQTERWMRIDHCTQDEEVRGVTMLRREPKENGPGRGVRQYITELVHKGRCHGG